MSRFQKALDKLLQVPPPANLSWSELVTILEHFGYAKLKPGKTGGSRRKFYHKEKDALISCHEPHPQPDVDRNCIRDVVDHLRDNGFI